MTILGLILDMVGALILGFEPQLTLWDTGTHQIVWLHYLGWGFIIIGFGLVLVSELLQKKGRHKSHMDNKIKKIIAREGLIIIILLAIAGLSLMLDTLQSKRFDSKGNIYMNDDNIKRYNLFIPEKTQKPSGFDMLTAIPIDTSLSREDYIALAKKELLNRSRFSNIDIVWFDELEKRFGTTSGEKVDRYYEEREKVKKEMKDWGETHLAAMAGISLEHFYSSVKKINYLKQKINFSGAAFSFAFLAYPLYLLIRFILWAIRILKQK